MADTSGITLLGLGPGNPDLLTREAWRVLREASEVHVRTRQHPVVPDLMQTVRVHSFDHLYESRGEFDLVYDEIVDTILDLGRRPQGVVYGVPGHPLVAEATGPEILHRARSQGLRVRLVEGLSFLEPTLTALELDPFPQLTLVDALELVSLRHPTFPPDAPALIAQLHSPAIASELKLTLMAEYPDEHPVKLVHAAGLPQRVLEELALHAMDQSPHIGLLTTLYLPPLGPATSFERFQEIIAHLRAPEGCPWDREQTHLSLRPYLLEETYEALIALDMQDTGALREELGDLLIQVVLHAQIASEEGEFTMSQVLQSVNEKLVRRHPHVFGDLRVDNVEGVKQNWERLKALERGGESDSANGLLDGVSLTLPALSQADAYQKSVAQVGFDWPELDGVISKVREEIDELLSAPDPLSQSAELGDLLFAVANLARWYDVDAESALRAANTRFRERFSRMEEIARQTGRPLAKMTLEEMDDLWEAAKKQGASQKRK